MVILLPQFPLYWDLRHQQPHPVRSKALTAEDFSELLKTGSDPLALGSPWLLGTLPGKPFRALLGSHSVVDVLV